MVVDGGGGVGEGRAEDPRDRPPVFITSLFLTLRRFVPSCLLTLAPPPDGGDQSLRQLFIGFHGDARRQKTPAGVTECP